jgi:hypothetical protein
MCMIEFKIEMDVVLYVHGGICLIRTGTGTQASNT